jgi:hypothetical protein|uniref:Uncharacterized protein n=1 Tax=viral metagenome TaxID=1070528 RepID=A0A6C0AI80_9ZZZZ
MDSQLTTLSSSYHDNYLQYKLTGNDSYKKAYESAKEGLDNIITAKKKELVSANQTIHDAMGADAITHFRQNQAGLGNLVEGIHEERDKVTAAQMRLPIPQPPLNYTDKLIAISVLLGVIVVLQYF